MDRLGNWMQTYTGKAYWPCDPRPQEIDIRDIAHHLSLLCRYTGACRRFYSVAEHSVIVSCLVPLEDALHGLLHDATEAYIGDLNRPVKHGPGMAAYRDIEARNWRAITDRFGIPSAMPTSVERADNDMLFHEQAALMAPAPIDWGMGALPPQGLRPDLIVGWGPEEAEEVFLRRFEELNR